MLTPLKIRENVELAPLTTLRVGGPARYFAVARNEDDIRFAIEFAETRDIPLFVLGGGSNLLVADSGFSGLVVQNRIGGVAEVGASLSDDRRRVLLEVGGGQDWDSFVEHSVAKDLAGVECLSGIPGTVGATPIQNVGAYGQEVAETIVSVACVDSTTGERCELANSECSFAYRASAFNSSLNGKYIVTAVRFALERGGLPNTAYRDLRERFAGTDPSLSDARAAVLNVRAAKSMVIDPADPNSRSAGSFFKNPIVSAEKLSQMQVVDENIPFFVNGTEYKIPAAWLIESSGVTRGYGVGRAGISSSHSLALINRGGATAAEIIVLRDEIRRRVADKFGVELQQEPIMVGF